MVKYRLAGIGGSDLLWESAGMVRRVHHGLQFLTGMEGHYATGRNGDFLAGLGVAPGPLGLGAKLEVAESRKLDAGAVFEGLANLLEETLDHVLGLALVQADALKKKVGELRLGQGHHGLDRLPGILQRVVPLNFSRSVLNNCSMAASISVS